MEQKAKFVKLNLEEKNEWLLSRDQHIKQKQAEEDKFINYSKQKFKYEIKQAFIQIGLPLDKNN